MTHPIHISRRHLKKPKDHMNPSIFRNITRARGTTAAASVSIVIHSPITTQSQPSSEELHLSTPDLINFNESPSLPVLVYQEDMGLLPVLKMTRAEVLECALLTIIITPLLGRRQFISPEISLSGLHSDSTRQPRANNLFLHKCQLGHMYFG